MDIDDGVEVAVKDEMIDSFYKKVDHLSEKEAAGSAVVIPFLGQVIEATLQRQHLLDHCGKNRRTREKCPL